jgi:hypothetical protein
MLRGRRETESEKEKSKEKAMGEEREGERGEACGVKMMTVRTKKFEVTYKAGTNTFRAISASRC